MKKLFLFSLFITMIFVDCLAQKTKNKFEIIGNVSGFADNTKLYLDYISRSGDAKTDSTFIIKNKFHFSGTLDGDVEEVVINTERYTDYKFLWIENSPVTFNAEKGKFHDAVIKGSKTQEEDDELALAVKKSGNEKEEDIKFIKSHPNSMISVNVISVYATSWGKDTAKMMYDVLSEKLKNTSKGKNIFDFISVNKNVKIGDVFADFTQANIDGKNISVSDYKGKVFLLEFWGSWCGPCREGNPELVKIYNEFKEKGFDILGVAADKSKNDWTDAVHHDGLMWQNVCDLNGDKNKAVLIYGISYYPSNFLIDKNGIIVARDLRGDDLRNKLRELLQ
jgi:peroxiredoxin